MTNLIHVVKRNMVNDADSSWIVGITTFIIGSLAYDNMVVTALYVLIGLGLVKKKMVIK